MSGQKVRVAFIGLGRIASLLEDDPLREKPATHAGAFRAAGVSSFVGGYDIDPERAELFAGRWGTPIYHAPDQLLAATRPEILVIATHPDSHERYARLAVRAGVAVVVCEKPLADTRARAARIVRLERHSATRFVINHERRFSSDYRIVRSFVRSRTLGRLVSLRGTLYFGRSTRLDRMLLHDGTHLLDTIHFVSGELFHLRRIDGRLRSSRSSAYLVGHLSASAVPVIVEIGAERDHLVFEIELSFEAGRVRVGNGVFEVARSDASPHYSGYRSLVDTGRLVPRPTGYFVGMARAALGLATTPGMPSESPAAAAAAAVSIIRRAGFHR